MRIERTAIVTASLATVWLVTVVLLFATTAARIARRGTFPHDLGAEAHEQAAQQAAAESQRVQESPCPPGGGTVQSSAVCWSPLLATPGQRARFAEQQRKLAEAHRSAAAELQSETEAACADVEEADRNASPFSNLEDLDGAQALRGPHASKQSVQPSLGVTVFVRPVPGLTEHRLRHFVNCYVAQNALLGHVSTSGPNDPLVPAGVTATVRSAGDRFAVDIMGNSSEVVREIEARTQRLVGDRWME